MKRRLFESVTDVLIIVCLLFMIDFVTRIFSFNLLAMTGDEVKDMVVTCLVSWVLIFSGLVRYLRHLALGFIREE
ncbi:hypothetical protein ACPV5L_17380 [Vibrio astriarenae]